MQYEAGWSRKTLSPFRTPVVMMGYGNEKNQALEHATDLFARSVWIQDGEDVQVHLYLDIAYITDYIFEGLLKELRAQDIPLRASELFVSANHTHAGPGGINEFLYYEVPTPGLQPDIVERIISTSVATIKEAKADLEKAEIYFHKGSFPLDWDVAFNRSIPSYRLNAEIEEHHRVDPRNSIDRTMNQINIIKGKRFAVINWFGVHGTCMSPRNDKYHFDNKGYACQYMEDFLGEDSLAIFAQASAGDVTPNNVFDVKMKTSRGSFEVEDKNAQKVGRLQYELAKQIFEERGKLLQGPFKHFATKLDFSKLSQGDFYTTSASFGVAMIQGTKEGPGIPGILAILLKTIVKLTEKYRLLTASGAQKQSLQRHLKAQGNKYIFIDASEKRLLGFKVKNKVRGLDLFDPLIKRMNKLLGEEPYKSHESWYNEKAYLNVMLWGETALVSLPFEITTMSSARIKREIQQQYPQVKDVIVNGYSYSYLGYLTTPEEYQNQYYEGGHSVFGMWTLPLVIEEIKSNAAKAKQLMLNS